MKASEVIGSLFLISALLTGIAQHDQITTQKRRIDTLDADVVSVNLRLQALRLAVDPLQAQIDTVHSVDMQRCRDRTLCLRASLETLIKVWPGRARVPDTCGDWPDWPVPSENLEHAR